MPSLRATIAESGIPEPNMSPISAIRSSTDGSRNWQLLPLTIEDTDAIMPVTEWVDRDIEITLDSGACENVMDAEDAPGYLVTESAGSRRGQNFVVGDGGRLPNEGQMQIHMESPIGEGVSVPVRTNFQVAGVNRPLMSVAKLSAQGHTCVLNKDGARVLNDKQQTIAEFKENNGIYVPMMTLKGLAPFTRPADA